MKKQTVAEILGDFVHSTRYEEIDEQTLWRAKMCILDMLGVIIAAYKEDSTRILLRILKRYGGEPESSVLGTNFKMPSVHAAMLNSTMAHSLELEDHHSHKRSLNHPGVCTIPPALAIAEREGKSGKEFLTSVVLGYEIGSRLSAATKLGVLNLERGFHESSVYGPFSAATTAGKLLGCTGEELARAYGICGSLTAGSMEFKNNEAWTKRLQVGNASRNGILAVELAREGFTGPTTVFEGKHGFYRSYVLEGNYDLSKLTDGLGKKWDINYIQYKPFACAGILHSAVTAAQKAKELYRFSPDEIENIVIKTASKVVEEYAEPAAEKMCPRNPVGAQFSLQYSVAVMLVCGKALLNEFSAETIRNPQILKVARMVHPQVDPSIDCVWPATDPSEIIITLANGREIHVRVEYAKGDLADPVTDDELIVKFKELMEPFLNPAIANHIIELCKNIERIPTVKELIDKIVIAGTEL